MERIERLRYFMAENGLDALVMTYPQDVQYATGYKSVFERWGQHEPVAAAIVCADKSKPVILALPEANLGLLAVLASQGLPDRAAELRVFDLLNFCEVVRAPDPFARASAIGEESMKIYGDRVVGKCESDLFAALAAALTDHGLIRARVGFDDLRVGNCLSSQGVGLPLQVLDGIDVIMRARMVKTAPELAAFRRSGRVGDAAMQCAADALRVGGAWDEVQHAVASLMVKLDAIPVDEGAMLFGGSFQGEFIPELFRTRSDRPLSDGQIVILEILGTSEDVWIDINRTATIGAPKPEFQKVHDVIRDGYLQMVDYLRPGNSTRDIGAIAHRHLVGAGISAPDRLLVMAHGIGLTPVEFPLPYPSLGRAGVAGFELEPNMVISLDCLYFGSEHGPCHMENVFIIDQVGATPLYETPLELLGPR